MFASAAREGLLRPDSPWFWPLLGVVFAADVALFGWWGVTVWRERRQAGGTWAVLGRATRRPRHAPTGRAVTSAVSVREIKQRLDRERRDRVVMARRPPRRVTVIHRVAPPAETGRTRHRSPRWGSPMTTGEDPFAVIGHRDTERVRYTAASAVAAATVVRDQAARAGLSVDAYIRRLALVESTRQHASVLGEGFYEDAEAERLAD